MTTPDKRLAMIKFHRDLLDQEMQSCMSMAQGLRQSGDVSGAERYEEKSRHWNAIYNGESYLASEYQNGLQGKFGIPKSITALIDAKASAYAKASKEKAA